MESIFEQTDYRSAFRLGLETRKRLHPQSSTYQWLAGKMRVQKAYLSKVMKGRAHLSPDQLELGCQALGLTEPETEYLELLLAHERSAISSRKDRLMAKLQRIQRAQSSSQAQLKRAVPAPASLTEYYLDPLTQLTHIALSIAKFSREPLVLANTLRVAPERIEASLKTLEQLGLIAFSDGAYSILVPDVHLDPRAPAYSGWRAQQRLWALQRLQTMSHAESYSFSVVFSADESTRSKIHRKFLDLLKEAEPLVKNAPNEAVYQMSFDLFPWTG